MIVGYTQRDSWPERGKFTLCAWFVDGEAITEALKASGIMATRAKKKAPKRKRTKQRRRIQG